MGFYEDFKEIYMVFNKKLNISMGFYDFYGDSINSINHLASGGRRTGADGWILMFFLPCPIS